MPGTAGMTGPPPGIYAPSSAAPPVPVFLPESRPATIALANNLQVAGDSLQNAVGAGSAWRWQVQMAPWLTAGAIVNVYVSGSAYRVPSATVPEIPVQVTGVSTSPAERAANDFTSATGVNCYNVGVVTAEEIRTWPDAVNTGLASISGSLTGPPTQLRSWFAGYAQEQDGPGMRQWANWRQAHDAQQAIYGPDVFDIRRYQQTKCRVNPADLDRINFDQWWGVPLSQRGMGIDGFGQYIQFADNPQTAWMTLSFTPNNAATLNGLLPPGALQEGTLLQNTNPTFALGNNVYRVGVNSVAALEWSQLDDKHDSRWGLYWWAIAMFDTLAARTGQGAPMGAPQEIFCARDAPAGTVCGTIHYHGSAAPTLAGLFDSAGVLVTHLVLTVNPPVNLRGTITVTRAATGVLVGDEQLLTLQLEGNGYVLHSAVDFRIGRPSTQTTPTLWTIPNTLAVDSRCAFSGNGYNQWAPAATSKISIVVWAWPAVLGSVMYLADLHAAYGHLSQVLIRIGAAGQFQLVTNNEAGTLLTNSSVGGAFSVANPTWVAVVLDTAPALSTVTGQRNTRGAGFDTPINLVGLAGATTIDLRWTVPRFFALRDASFLTQNYATADPSGAYLRGAFGNIVIFDGDIGIAANPAIARVFWDDVTGAPTPRVPYSPVNGLTPLIDIQGDPGDFLRGGFNQASRVYMTYRGVKGLTPA